MLVASHLSRNKFLVIVVKIYKEADFKVFWYSPILVDFFTYFQIFCPGWLVFIIPGNTLSDSIKTGIISVASKKGDYIKIHLKISHQKI